MQVNNLSIADPNDADMMDMAGFNATAPEIIKGQGYSYAVDVWSIGVSMYQIMSGELPFECGSMDPYDIYKLIA